MIKVAHIVRHLFCSLLQLFGIPHTGFGMTNVRGYFLSFKSSVLFLGYSLYKAL